MTINNEQPVTPATEHKKAWIIGGIVLAFILLMAVVAGGSKDAKPKAVKATAPVVHNTTPPTTPKVDEQQAWINAYGGDVVTTLDDLQTLKDDVDAGASDAVLAADCAIVKGDTDMVLGNPPMPNAQQAVDLAGFTSNLGTAMDACVALAVNGDQSAADLFASSFTAAMDYATKLMDDLGIGA